jgi:hypothetical protein
MFFQEKGEGTVVNLGDQNTSYFYKSVNEMQNRN